MLCKTAANPGHPAAEDVTATARGLSCPGRAAARRSPSTSPALSGPWRSPPRLHRAAAAPSAAGRGGQRTTEPGDPPASHARTPDTNGIAEGQEKQ
jgi:hypothetical protein